MGDRINEEPIRFVAAIQATVALAWIVASQLGWSASPELIGSVELVVATWLAFGVRNSVTPA